MTTVSTAPPATERSRGRGYFWVGLGVCVLGPALLFSQLKLKQLFMEWWYAPALATLAAVLLLAAVARRRSIPRVTALVLVAAFAGLQWFIFGALLKLPSYEGPAKPGEQFPAFSATLADGRPFTDADLRDGSRHAMVFFRGRW
jgi:hypothetical protein